MPSNDRTLELKANISMAQTASQATVYAKGLVEFRFNALPGPSYSHITTHLIRTGARGVAVFEALRYKPEIRGFDSQLCHWNFSLT
jgi:hypothetical protein